MLTPQDSCAQIIDCWEDPPAVAEGVVHENNTLAARGLAVYDIYGSLSQTFIDAQRYNQCVQIGMPYVSFLPVSWKRYNC
jgi:hypothetical protein